MRHSPHLLTIAATALAAALSPSALAQTAGVMKSTCQTVGIVTTEPIGDRPGHAIAMNTYSCRNEGGATDGTVMTGSNIREIDAGGIVSFSQNGVVRKPGAIAVYELTADKMSMSQTGFSGESKGTYKFASGSLAPLSGKSFSSKYHSIGGGQFVIETTLE